MPDDLILQLGFQHECPNTWIECWIGRTADFQWLEQFSGNQTL